MRFFRTTYFSIILLFQLGTGIALAQQMPEGATLFQEWVSRQQVLLQQMNLQFTESAKRMFESRRGNRELYIETIYQKPANSKKLKILSTIAEIDGKRIEDDKIERIGRGPIAFINFTLQQIPQVLLASELANMRVENEVKAQNFDKTIPAWRICLINTQENVPVEHLFLWFSQEDHRLLGIRAVLKMPPSHRMPPPPNSGNRRAPRPPVVFAFFQQINGLDYLDKSYMKATFRHEIRGRTVHYVIRQSASYSNFSF